ncbi:hypothetical protein [Bradyrhizobium lablabi]|uniref:hypothetical protein n=1 Tax=Bradyrhizobium lablabi TaxID=722472 RepID=UPI001BA55B62|nr:hypothetical protein [Bradyrhizobium lablabi]MBR0693370.1 hypothetical protein [Bradyrhizobium lablabi]
MNQSDPTDNALAAIASILDQATAPPEPAKAQEGAADSAPEQIEETAMVLPPPGPQPIEASGYSKVGPGPIAALRFRWTVREDNGRYYVDEAVGETSTPVVNGPMDRNAAINFVDDCEAKARQRFEHFRQQMTGRTAAPDGMRGDDDYEG